MNNKTPKEYAANSSAPSGFTLIELIVGTVVLSMLIISIAALYFSIDRIQNRSQDLDAATRAAEQQIESLRNQHYKTLDPGDEIDFSEALPERLERLDAEAVVAIEEPEPDLRELTATISFDERGGDGSEEVVMSAIIGRLGISQ